MVGDIFRKVPLGYLYITIELHRDFPVGQSAVFFFFCVWIGDQKEEEEEKHQPKKKSCGFRGLYFAKMSFILNSRSLVNSSIDFL